jgi:hypothetical protein
VGLSADVLSSSVANRTVSHFGFVDVVVAEQVLTHGKLVTFRLPPHLKHMFPWTDELLWLLMTLNAPLHIERIHFPHQRHLVNTSVTGFTAYTFTDVNAVIEIDEIRQVVDTDPFDGFVGPITCANRLEDRGLCPNLRMAGHAGFYRRDTGKGSFFY